MGKRVIAGIYEILAKHFSNLLKVIPSFRFTPLEIILHMSRASGFSNWNF
jgi:hypothetical protein